MTAKPTGDTPTGGPQPQDRLPDTLSMALVASLGRNELEATLHTAIRRIARTEARITELEEALRDCADQTLSDGTRCYCLEERTAKGYTYGLAGGQHSVWCDKARAALAGTPSGKEMKHA